MAEYNKIADKGEVAFINKTGRVIIVGKCDESDFLGKTKSMDGKIGKIKQGATGDCWLLAAVNSLSYSPKGRQIIKDSIKYTKDGAIVNFKGLDCFVYVPYKKIYGAKLSTTFNFGYSSGDDDMKVIELATEKVIEEYCKGNIVTNKSAKYTHFYKPKSESLDGNFAETAWKLLCGQNIELKDYYDIDKMMSAKPDLANYSFGTKEYKCSKDFWSGKKYREVTDVRTGKKVKLYPRHAYSIKSIDKNGNVLLVNPWDNDTDGEETVLVSKKEIAKGQFESAKIV